MTPVTRFPWRRAVCGVALVAVLAGCSSGTSTNGEDKTAPARDAKLVVDRRLTAATTGFSFRLFSALAEQKPGANVFISAPSVELALAMTMNGAGGSTLEGMGKTLGLEALSIGDINAANAQLMALLRNPDAQVEVSVANSLWGRAGVEFDPGFLERNTTSYEAEVRTVDFADPASAAAINDWVDEKTKARITKLVEHDAIKDAILVLANAIYFKGKWTLPFDPKLTQDGPFTPSDGKAVTLPMMRQTDQFPYGEVDGAQVISLPYGSRHVDAVVVLPKAGTSEADFRKQLTAENWAKWVSSLELRKGTIVLPRFKSEFSTSLKPALEALGMDVAFTGEADFKAMLTPASLAALGGVPFISDVVHKTALEVNEEGTVAAAATGVVVGATSAPVDTPFTMTVDRPFFLALRDAPTGVVLFMGVINNPKTR